MFNPDDMLAALVYPHPVGRLELRETAISWIFLTGLFAYKVQKPVKLEFLDASTLDRRHDLCEEELRLNRRLACDLYLDVVPLTQTPEGLRIGGHGLIVEYAVRMKQFDASQELCNLLDRDAVEPAELGELAALLVDFHARAPQAAREADFPHTRQLHDAVLGNLAVLLAHRDADSDMPEMGSLIDFPHDFLHDSLGRLRLREQAGFIRECHGDLHSRNIVRWRGHLVPFDCLEFDPKLRWIDVMNDIAFLVMDLIAHGRSDLAFCFLNAYLEGSGDYDGLRLLKFYGVYRALVRAMVDSIGIERNPAQRDTLRHRLRTRLETAAGLIGAPAPTLVIMHGPAASGKSWLSERLCVGLGAVRIRSDVERKRLFGAASDGGYLRGIYTPELSRRTYAHLRDCAESCLLGGLHAVIDAAFLDAVERASFLCLAERNGCPFVIVACSVERGEQRRRIESRRGLDPSDAGMAVLENQLLHMQPLSAVERAHAVSADTREAQISRTVLAAIRGVQDAYAPAAARRAVPGRTAPG